jgi:hypothetical protein
MKLVCCFLLFLTFVSFGYNQIISPDKAIDGRYIKSTCDVDTIITFYFDSEFIWIDSIGHKKAHYQFDKGSHVYCEVILKTKNCNCKDCSFLEKFIIRIDDFDNTDFIHLNPSNTTWIVINVWRYYPFIDSFSGTLDFNNQELKLYGTEVGDEFTIFYPPLIFKHVMLAKPERH